MDWSSLGIAVLSAVIYSLSMYVKKHLNPDNPQAFDKAKFLTTLIWGIIIGVVLQLSGVPITEQTVEEQFVAYAGLIAITENIIKAVIRAVRRLK
jgi:hypothetical protein